MTDKQADDSEGEQMSDYMKPPYTVDLSDSIADDERDCWVIDNDRGSVAEMTCPADDAEATARFIAHAVNVHEERERLLNVSLDLLSDVYESRAAQRFSTIGLSRIQSHIADLRAALASKEVVTNAINRS